MLQNFPVRDFKLPLSSLHPARPLLAHFSLKASAWLPLTLCCMVVIQINVFHTQGAVKPTLATVFPVCLHGKSLKEIIGIRARRALWYIYCAGFGRMMERNNMCLQFCGRPIKFCSFLLKNSLTLFSLRYQRNSFGWFSSWEIWLSLNSGRFGKRHHSSVAMTGSYFLRVYV